MKKSLFFLLLWFPVLLQAQGTGDFLNSFEEFERLMNQEFIAFKDSADAIFAKALEEQWKEFQAFTNPAPVKPNPQTPPVVNTPPETPPTPIEIPIKEIIPPQRQEPEPPQQTDEDRSQAPSDNRPLPHQKTIHLWNSVYKIPYDISLEQLKLTNTQEKTIADFWRSLSNTNYQPVINAMEEIVTRCELSDYGLALLCHEYAKSVWTNNTQESKNQTAVLFVFLLNQLSLDAKIARTSQGLEAILHSLQEVYAIAGMEINRKNYYFLFTPYSPLGGIYTYEVNRSEKTTGLDFNIYKPLNIGGALVKKELPVQRLDKTVTLTFSENAIAYYKDHPQVEPGVYADAAVSDVFRSSFMNQFGPLLAGKTEYEAVDILLNFMHYAFEYKTDGDQYGYEKWNFCEENLYYPYNDCEDRAFLFSRLVRELLHLEVALVQYSNHFSTAVHFTTPVSGSYFTIDGKRFTVCDPTYIGAMIGMNPEQYKIEKAEIVKLKKY